jgi:hypothetical protein
VRYLRLIAGLLAALCLWSADSPAEQLAKQAEKAERAGQIVEAYLLYAKAALADPHNPLYWTKASSLRAPATVMSEKRLPALGTTGPPPKLDPNIVGSLTRAQLNDIERMLAPPRLKPVPGVRGFQLRAEPRALFEAVAAVYGYTVIFEKDYPLAGQPMRFNLADIDYIGALHALEAATNSFIVPLSDKVMLVAQDTTQKRQELEANEAVGIPIPQRTSVQEAQELTMMVQQALEIRRVAIDPVKRLIYLRDRASKVELARALLSQLSGGKAQVATEIEFISVGKTSSLNFGLTLPTQFPLVNFGSALNSKPSIPAGFMRFLTFGGGKTFLGLGLTDAALFATASRADASSLLRSEVRSSDGQPTTLHIGDKYPIQTGAYLGSGGILPGGTTYAVISTSSYADLTSAAVSTTGSMSLVVNGQPIPFDLPAGTNNLIGLQTILSSLGAGVGAQTIQRGTRDRPLSLLVVANTLGISSIQLIDDPNGAKISLLKTPDVVSVISTNLYQDPEKTVVSKTLTLNLTVGSSTVPLLLTEATNNLNGQRDAINKASAGVTASVLTTGTSPFPFYMQIVANSPNSGAIQVFDDPPGENTPLFSSTTEVDSVGNSLGGQVPGQSSSSVFGQTYSPPPTFNFEDLGLVLKITPFVHDMEEVTLEIEAEFKVLGSGSYNGVPVISTRKYQGKVRLRTSQYAIVAGLVSETEARSITGIAGLARLPVLGALFREDSRSNDASDVLLVIKPRIISFPASEMVTRGFWYGSEMKPLTLL